MEDKTAASTYKYRDQDGEVRTIRVTGHRLLVRKCLKPEDSHLVGTPSPDIEYDPLADTMLNSLRSNTMQNICEVLAIGPECGKPREKSERKRLGVMSLSNPVQCGHLVVLPETGLLWNNVTGSLDDIIVDESEVVCIIED